MTGHLVPLYTNAFSAYGISVFAVVSWLVHERSKRSVEVITYGELARVWLIALCWPLALPIDVLLRVHRGR